MTHGMTNMERENKMYKEPKFCNKCGEKLLVKSRVREFNIYTGEEVLDRKTYRCPNYNRVSGRFHFLSTVGTDKAPPVVPSSRI